MIFMITLLNGSPVVTATTTAKPTSRTSNGTRKASDSKLFTQRMPYNIGRCWSGIEGIPMQDHGT